MIKFLKFFFINLISLFVFFLLLNIFLKSYKILDQKILSENVDIYSFELINHKNEKVTYADLKGNNSLIFFGFVNCPDVCPITLHKLSNVVKKINIKNDKKIKIYFVTLNPNRDSPKIMKNYLSSFDDSIIGLTGDSKEIQRLAKSLNVKHIKKTLNGSNYTIDHTASVIMLDKNAKKVGEIFYLDSEELTYTKIISLK